MFQLAEIEGNFTNHSLRATCATQLYDAGVPEAVVQKQTEHKSVEALRLYERVTPKQQQLVSSIISPPADQNILHLPELDELDRAFHRLRFRSSIQ